MIKTIRKFFLIAAFLYVPFHSMAWGLLGHRIVGEIAESHLSPKAKKAIQEILGNESMAMASNWPDFIKSDPSFNYLNAWHYINFKDGYSYDDMKAYLAVDTITDAYTKINFLVKELKSPKLDKSQKAMYVKLLIHIVGDVHQPMHVGREEDLGGNKIKVLWFSQPTNLHSIWDEKLIDEQKLSYTEYVKAINYSTPAQRAEWQKQPVSKWLYESYEIAQQLYAEIKQPDQKLSYRYNFDHIETLNNRLLKGGVRLAGILNEIFG